MTDKTCKSCKFYVGKECRRYPPQVIYDRTLELPLTLFPRPYNNDWCNEYFYERPALKEIKCLKVR